MKDHGLVHYFSRHRVAPNILMLAFLIAGVFFLNRLPIQLLPDVRIEQLNVSVRWPNADMELVEQQLVNPIESRLKSLEDIRDTYSYSRDGYANLSISYEFGTDMDQAEERLRADLNRFSFPEGAELGQISGSSFNEPVMFIVVSHAGEIQNLRSTLLDWKQQLTDLGLGSIDLWGLPPNSAELELNARYFLNHADSLNRVRQAVTTHNQQYSLGSVSNPQQAEALVSGEVSQNLLQILQTPVGDNQVLADIVTLKAESPSQRRELYFGEQRAVLMQISRRQDTDSLDSAKLFNEWRQGIEPSLPDSIKIGVFYDVSDFVAGNVNLLIKNGIAGLVMVLLTLFLFLNSRIAIWTALGIPVALMGTVVLLQQTGGSLNFLSIFAMLMALGIIVDDAIVVGEEALTRFQQNGNALQASTEAANTMLAPVVASSLTTIAAFSPLLFLPGSISALLSPIPIVIICVIAASLIECFLILPGHLRHSLSNQKARSESGFRARFDRAFFGFRDRIYRPIVEFFLLRPWYTVITAFSLFLVSIFLVSWKHVTFNSELSISNNQIDASLSMQAGTSYQELRDAAQVMLESLHQADQQIDPQQELVVASFYNINQSSLRVSFTVNLVDRDQRQVSNVAFLAQWKQALPEISGLRSTQFGNQSDGSDGQQGENRSIAFFLQSDDLKNLKSGSEAFKLKLEQLDYLENVRDNFSERQNRWNYQLNAVGRDAGISQASLSQQLSQALHPIDIAQIQQGGESVSVRLAIAERLRQHIAQLDAMPIQSPSGQTYTLAQVSDRQRESALTSIIHSNGQMGVTVSADLLDEARTPQEVIKLIRQDILPSIQSEFQLNSELTGNNAEVQQTINNLIWAAVAALLAIYLILAWSFQSYSWPLAVMAAIPLGLTGALFGHWFMDLDLSFLSIFGFFGLGGIIVNDAIILISRFQKNREQGQTRHEAIVNASCQRFRAVLLTSFTTIAGLVPILFETSVQAQLVQSMAASLAFGLLYGSALILVVIPALLQLLEQLNRAGKRIKSWYLPQDLEKV